MDQQGRDCCAAANMQRLSRDLRGRTAERCRSGPPRHAARLVQFEPASQDGVWGLRARVLVQEEKLFQHPGGVINKEERDEASPAWSSPSSSAGSHREMRVWRRHRWFCSRRPETAVARTAPHPPNRSPPTETRPAGPYLGQWDHAGLPQQLLSGIADGAIYASVAIALGDWIFKGGHARRFENYQDRVHGRVGDGVHRRDLSGRPLDGLRPQARGPVWVAFWSRWVVSSSSSARRFSACGCAGSAGAARHAS